jgi:hypothetical protein
MLYHPHVHFLVSAGGLSADRQSWVPAKNPRFLVPVRALSVIFRAKMRRALKTAGVLPQVPPSTWTRLWVVHAQHAGSGQKVLDYLGRYVFHIAISHSRLEALQQGQVTFRYRDNRTQQVKKLQLPAAEFIKRFLQHVLPRGLAKVRHYGLASPAAGQRHATAMTLLQAAASNSNSPAPMPQCSPPNVQQSLRCPHCMKGQLVLLGQLLPQRKIPP